jgi:acetyl-CoA carboxylase biotin carboxyl carrier protein
VEDNQETSSAEDKLASNLKQIKSPMVGTVYRAPAPGSEPFIDIGQPVAVGQTVCIVEAMKLMNEIGSDFSGVIRRVLVENGQPVEYGQPLFLIETK